MIIIILERKNLRELRIIDDNHLISYYDGFNSIMSKKLILLSNMKIKRDYYETKKNEAGADVLAGNE